MTATAATSHLAGTTYVPGSADKKAPANGATEAQDRFLKLLVAQLSNQDPMNPMDNAQMTSQIAQINTVTGIQQLNETMKGMNAQMSAMQMLQAGNLVGRNVLLEGDRLVVDATAKTAVGFFELPAKATDVKVQVMTAGGQVIDTVSLGEFEVGQQGFKLDASRYPADTALKFKVIAANGSTPVDATPMVQDKVLAVGSDAGALSLTLLGAGKTPYADVRAVL